MQAEDGCAELLALLATTGVQEEHREQVGQFLAKKKDRTAQGSY